MNLFHLLCAHAEAGRAVRLGLIGAGKFGAMFLAQARVMTGVHVVGVVDLDVERARAACRNTGWPDERCAATSPQDARASGRTVLTDDAAALLAAGGLDVLVEATGDPAAGIRHCLWGIDQGCHVVMVNVEADVLAGPLLARRARAAGVVYSLAWGDQPALICEHVDWARACGFTVVCAGKGTRYHPSFHRSTPETVWGNIGFDPVLAERGGMNPKMFNSFIDGTKSSIEMAAVCNATGLTPQPGGLGFPPAAAGDLAEVCKPVSAGGAVSHTGTTEVVSSLHRDRTPVENHLALGTYVVITSDNPYVHHCLEEYNLLPDSSFRYAALYRPTHLIGLELGVSVASAALRKEPTGTPVDFVADVVATAKRNLRAGEMLDGEGGYCVWGKQTPARHSLEQGLLPLGFANRVTLKNDIAEGDSIRWEDVACHPDDDTVRVRREMEAVFGPQTR